MAYFDGIKVGDKVYSANDDEWTVLWCEKNAFGVTKNGIDITVKKNSYEDWYNSSTIGQGFNLATGKDRSTAKAEAEGQEGFGGVG